MILAPNELARRTQTGAAYRHEPLRLTLVVGPVVARDGHSVSANVSLSLRLVDREADLELFREQLLTSDTVTIDSVRQRLTPPLATSFREFAQQHDASQCLGQRSTIAQLLFQRANEIGFACGLEFLPPVEADVHCPSLDAERAAEQLARQQAGRLGQAAEVLERLRSLGGAAQLRPDEQATLLELLLRNQKPCTARIVAGANLLACDPATGSTVKIELPSDIGPLRSVRHFAQGGVSRTLVGGQRGVAVLFDRAGDSAPQNGDQSAVYLTQTANERGFNSVAIDAGSRTIIAAHGELGLVRWNVDDAQALAPVAVEGAPRFLTPIDERMLFAVGSDLMVVDAGAARVTLRGNAPILGVLNFSDCIVVVRDDGTVEQLDRGTLQVRHRFDRSTKLTAAAAMEVEGLQALLLAGESGPVECVSLAGQPLLELHSPHRGLRMLAVCGGQVAAVSADRQHLVIWDGWKPDAPARSVNIVARAGHRAADICCA
jgi:hypothetical protein